MGKNELFMKDIISKYHPEFIASKDLRRYGLKYPHIFNIERLVEESLAAVGGYTFVDETGRDFDDAVNSDSKTVSVNQLTRRCEIGSVENKIGALRITIYNPIKHSADFLYMSHADLLEYKMPCYGKNSFKERLVFTWQEKGDHYNSYERFRVDTFEDLATLMQ